MTTAPRVIQRTKEWLRCVFEIVASWGAAMLRPYVLRLLHQEVLEFGEVVGSYVGDGAHLHAAFAPVDPVIAQLRAGERLGIKSRRGPDEDVDEMLAARVDDEHGDGAAVYAKQIPKAYTKSKANE
jgi:hypothetical protein